MDVSTFLKRLSENQTLCPIVPHTSCGSTKSKTQGCAPRPSSMFLWSIPAYTQELFFFFLIQSQGNWEITLQQNTASHLRTTYNVLQKSPCLPNMCLKLTLFTPSKKNKKVFSPVALEITLKVLLQYKPRHTSTHSDESYLNIQSI